MLFRMAAFQESYKWIAVFLFFSATGLVRWVSGCSSSSKELHICLNIYLERDFSLIETYMNGQQQSCSDPRRTMILEGMDLDNICNHISSLYNCYWALLPECDSLWKYDRYVRVMDVMNATQNHLCTENKNNLKDVLKKSECLICARSHTAQCTGFDWMMSWRHVLRMQKSPSDTCGDLQTYWDCLRNRLTDVVCGPQTIEVYQKLIDVWMRHWCGKHLTTDEERKYFYKVVDKNEEILSKAHEELERRAKLNNISLANYPETL